MALILLNRRDGGEVKGCIYRSRASSREKLNSNVRKGIFMIELSIELEVVSRCDNVIIRSSTAE